MLDALRAIFTRPDTSSFSMEPQMAVAALLVHLAAVDGNTSPAEKQAVRRALSENYDVEDGELDQLIAEATRRDAESVDFYRFTSALSSLESEERVRIIEMMWQVVFADNQNHELEDNMVWRIAELIGVSARDRTVLRARMARQA